ncbi:Transposable element Tcb2 transposase [Rhizoctonia solani]|uniref:Transposable element Tcb2 transposase n=1 Tax=Rhizoctonia solani TaxID=456999 RepID=A0A8H8P8F3_9AGAM|nr:Transposable element Tcb2 transposase [Rhizoctonia solani]QRW25731.1 Transposable element Tcb2 transposase [Rhizoctonia solani]
MAQYTSPKTKAQIIALKKLKYSDWAIVQLLQPETKVSHATVGCIWAKYGLADCPLNQHNPIPGRPQKLTPSNIRFAALALAWSRVLTAANIRQQYFPAIGSSTLCCYLQELGLWPYKRCQVPLLTYQHRKAHCAWAHSQLFWPQSRWDNIVFSDKVQIKLFGANSGQYYWRQPGESLYNPQYTKKTISHGGGGIFIWGCVTQEGVGQLYLIQCKLNALGYIEILGDAFFGTLANYKITLFDITFQHDQDPKHTARLTQHWLASWGVSVLPWLSKSLDLNIIENVWWHLKEHVRTHQPPTSNKEELWKIVRDKWKQISPKYIGNLYDSLPHQVQAVYLAKGGNTKY